jgi:hypothetical protein
MGSFKKRAKRHLNIQKPRRANIESTQSPLVATQWKKCCTGTSKRTRTCLPAPRALEGWRRGGRRESPKRTAAFGKNGLRVPSGFSLLGRFGLQRLQAWPKSRQR